MAPSASGAGVHSLSRKQVSAGHRTLRHRVVISSAFEAKPRFTPLARPFGLTARNIAV